MNEIVHLPGHQRRSIGPPLLPQFVYLRLYYSPVLGSKLGGETYGRNISDRGESMKDTYPDQLACDPSPRDFQDLLASFRQVTEERNALRSDNERLHEVLEGVPDAWLHRYQFRAV